MMQFFANLLPGIKVLLVGFIFIFVVRPVAAAPSITITSLPSTLVAGQSFTLTASASSLVANATYYVKVRLGASTDSLNKGQTNNSINDPPDDWLGDTDSWTKFPQVTADTGAIWSGNIIGRPSDSTTIGNNLVLVRMRKTDASTNYDSSTASVSVSPAPSSTPTSTPTSTPQATATPTSTSTPTKTPTPTVTRIPTPTLTPTKQLTGTPTDTPDETPETVPVVLGKSVGNDSSSPSAITPNNSWKPWVISMLLVATGLAILAGFFTWKIAREKYLSEKDDE